jgi:phosphoribosylamine--glycine ligase
MKVLLIGNGAREHALAEALSRSASKPEIIAFADKMNPGIKLLARRYELTDSLTNFEKLRALAEEEKPDFALIGPEAPIAAGTADLLEELGILSVAPKQVGGQLESSKSFTRDLIQKYNLEGNPDFMVFRKWDQERTEEQVMGAVRAYLDSLEGQFVIKADGLKSGKGVKVVGDHLAGVVDGAHYARKCLEEDGRVIIEEKLIGQEFSAMFLTDGKTLAAFPIIQDHKRAFEGDEGPNTGGMGTYSDANHSLPFLEASDLEVARRITEQVLQALNTETQTTFRGVMYGGFIATAKGVRLIEYNARFGDPEAMNVLPILKTDFVKVCEAVIQGRLAQLPLEFESKATVCKYVVPAGYPDAPQANAEITIGTLPEHCQLYYASVNLNSDGKLLTSSGRALALVGIADTLDEAEKIAEAGVQVVQGSVFHRKDIGTAALIAKRVEHMRALRSQA